MASTSEEPTLLHPRQKIWQLYIADAHSRDKARLEQWKGDTEGILIFTGLFAATVATFVVSTLPMLSPDSGNQTVELLQVLISISNSSSPGIVVPAADVAAITSTFDVPSSIVWLNAFWIVSLFLALSVALAATLVQQWARTYTLDSSGHINIGKRGLVHAALELGIERFGMENTTIVMTFLLHVSVFLFYGGLLIFLFTTNMLLARVFAALLGTAGLIYLGLSLMPIVVCDSPYHTRFSPLIVPIRHVLLSLLMPILEVATDHISSDWLIDLWAWYTNDGHGNLPPERILLRSRKMKIADIISPQTRFAWHKSAFKRLVQSADELHEILSFWEGYTLFVDSPQTDRELVKDLQGIAIPKTGLNVFHHIRALLQSLNSDNTHFARIAVVVCTLTRHVLHFYGVRGDSIRKTLEILALAGSELGYYDDSRKALGSRQACQLYFAEVQIMLLQLGSRSHSWFDDEAYSLALDRLRLVGALHLGTVTSTTVRDIDLQACLVDNFIGLFWHVLDWVNVLGLDKISATFQGQGTSWLSMVQNVCDHAVASAWEKETANLFIETYQGIHRLRPDSDVGNLLSRLGIADYNDLDNQEYTEDDSLNVMPFGAVKTRYRPFFVAHPEFARMLYALCAMLVDHKDVTASSVKPLASSHSSFQRYSPAMSFSLHGRGHSDGASHTSSRLSGTPARHDVPEVSVEMDSSSVVSNSPDPSRFGSASQAATPHPGKVNGLHERNGIQRLALPPSFTLNGEFESDGSPSVTGDRSEGHGLHLASVAPGHVQMHGYPLRRRDDSPSRFTQAGIDDLEPSNVLTTAQYGVRTAEDEGPANPDSLSLHSEACDTDTVPEISIQPDSSTDESIDGEPGGASEDVGLGYEEAGSETQDQRRDAEDMV
ncbi:unnamed protein product [Peniophora sp. CBMAI 1063]|nr:unnamed protein product [Peniophora sp. CBMAI 1063]